MHSSLPAGYSSHECLAAPAGRDWLPTEWEGDVEGDGQGGRGEGREGREGGGGNVEGDGQGWRIDRKEREREGEGKGI